MIFEFIILGTALVLVLSLTYSTAKLGISPMPSSKKAYAAMEKLLANTGTGPILDLGSGWGNFVIRFAKQHPDRQVVGYELSLFPWLVSVWLKYIFGLKNLTLRRQNFLEADFPSGSVLVCYLYPGAMRKIEEKLKNDSSTPRYLISNNFALSTIKADNVVRITDFYNSPIYRYELDSHKAEQC